MYKMFQNTLLTGYQLQAVFTEIETIVNNHPLTYFSHNCEDINALTPNHFLIGKYNNGSDSFSKTAQTNLDSRKQWR